MRLPRLCQLTSYGKRFGAVCIVCTTLIKSSKNVQRHATVSSGSVISSLTKPTKFKRECESAPREALASSCSLKSRGGSSEAGGLWSHRRATWGGISEVERHPSRRRGILQASNDCRAVRQAVAWQKAAISSGKSLLTSLQNIHIHFIYIYISALML